MSKSDTTVETVANQQVLDKLCQIIDQRKHSGQAKSSYVASLHASGLNKILEKVGEEATEAIIAAKDSDKQALINETADLWFHCLVMLSHFDLDANNVIAELANRFDISGIDEKASRSK